MSCIFTIPNCICFQKAYQVIRSEKSCWHRVSQFALADCVERGGGPKCRHLERIYNLTKGDPFICGWEKGTKKKDRLTLRQN